ncbi:MAG: uracil-DNA glycosylase [Rhodospirillales bacterium]|nr:uracil-DNA glycosylase [Rhodospirillales bacterium]
MILTARKLKLLEPAADCGLCPRLVEFRETNRRLYPTFENAPVPSFGGRDAELLIVGLAPGLKGANQTGRPFTGDYAGDLLYPTLIKFGFAKGRFGATRDDGLVLHNCRITNAVRCVPPANKPTGPEAATCRPFLVSEIESMPHLKVLLALGGLAHNAILTTFNARKTDFKFRHEARHTLPNGLILADSYHCSRYNTNTGRLTTPMFEQVFTNLQPLFARK